MDFDWKSAVKAIAPTIVGAVGTPAAGMATKVLIDAVLGGQATGDPVADEATLAGALAAGMTPELRAKIVEADNVYRIEVLRAASRAREIDADLDKAYIADTSDARKAHAGDVGVFRLGMAVLATFFLLMGVVTWGCFELLTGGLRAADPSTVGIVTGLLGTVIGYVAANAQQVIAYFFGSSKGSADKTAAMAAAVANVRKS